MDRGAKWATALFGVSALIYWMNRPRAVAASPSPASSPRQDALLQDALVAAAAAAADAAVRDRTSLPSRHDTIDLTSSPISRWSPYLQEAAIGLAPRMHVEIPQLASFALAWLGIESGGNPCAVGNRKLTIPPGHAPQEIGLFQIYNPDDFKALGVDPLEMVTYCVRPPAGASNPQKLSATMTEPQIKRHVEIGLRLIGLKHQYAGRHMAASGVKWPTYSVDYWRMTKAAHALPVLVSAGIPKVTKKLGRAPISWAEYRATYETINPRAKYDPEKARHGKEQDVYYRSLENAEWTGSQVATAPVA